MAIDLSTAPAYNRNGQRLGAKGSRSRQTIIRETVALLEETPVADLTMAAIVRRSGITPAAYYLYFEDVGAAILAALEEIKSDFDDLAKPLEEPWPSDRLFECAREFVDGYFAVWSRHASLLRARNALSDAGDARFVANRFNAFQPLVEAMTRMFEARVPQEVRANTTPTGLAGVLFTAIERSATVVALDLYPVSRGWEGLSKALAQLFVGVLKPSS